jgi:hypothetical protein
VASSSLSRLAINSDGIALPMRIRTSFSRCCKNSCNKKSVRNRGWIKPSNWNVTLLRPQK